MKRLYNCWFRFLKGTSLLKLEVTYRKEIHLFSLEINYLKETGLLSLELIMEETSLWNLEEMWWKVNETQANFSGKAVITKTVDHWMKTSYQKVLGEVKAKLMYP